MFDRFSHWLAAMATASITFGAGPALSAETAPVVVELYTSQGCSSCPPADEILGELAGRDDVIALSLHVDYWDYLGWRDSFATPDNTRRQVAYRDEIRARSVYTPQIIVNGVDRVVGSNRDAVMASIKRNSGTEPYASIDLSVVDGMLKAEISPLREADRPCTVWVVGYRTPAPVQIPEGENAGKTISYHNVARTFMRLGAWVGGQERQVMAPIPSGATGMAVILQEDDYGPIVGAARIDF